MKLLTICLFVAIATTAPANDVRELTWTDLVPATAGFDDPFLALSDEQLRDLSLVARLQGLLADNPAALTEGMKTEMTEATARLVADDVDIDGLLARREEIREKRRQAAEGLVPEIDGATVRMPGFALPLDHEGREVSEFLLVPYWGACIHMPPPPPNQIVYVVVTGDGRELEAYEPVWVAGEMTADIGERNLFYRDGAADIATGYTLHANLVQPYEQ